MSNIVRVSELDVIYLSYDEPNAEKNYADLLTKVPWAKRVHGVEGSDAAHKACARLSETDRFITIDGDNIISPEFINEQLHFKDDINLDNCVISWSGYNIVNGLTYGNGGIKCWPKHVVLNMKTHENADPSNPQAQVDFCWDLTYLQISKTYSNVYNNHTPQQAWRAGFREGVKMCLYEGEKLENKDFLSRVHNKNLERLRIWQNVGQDAENGLWAIYGARLGTYLTNCTDWDYINVRDFEYLNTLWKTYKDKSDIELIEEIQRLGIILNTELNIDISPTPFDVDQSKFFKSLYKNPPRVPVDFLIEETSPLYDIVMITYNEPNANQNWNKLKDRFPQAIRVDGVKGIHQAHIEAAKRCTTDMIWVVDGDAQVLDDFDFNYVTPDDEKDYVKVWRSRNPINDLEYGYGGIKLLPRVRTECMDVNKPDMTTSISRHFKPIKIVSNITAFNTDPFNTWRSAFRECAKLSSKVIDRQKSDETETRLKIWKTVGKDRPYGEYAIAGAIAGESYGITNSGDADALKKINDFDWLKAQFENKDKAEEIKIIPKSDNDRSKEFLHGLEEYCNFKSATEISKEVKSFLDILYATDSKAAFLNHFLPRELSNIYNSNNFEKELTIHLLNKNDHDKIKYFRYIKDFIKKDNDINTLSDALSRSQIKSKLWLIEELSKIRTSYKNIVLLAGWYGQLVDLFKNDTSNITFHKVRNVEIDRDACMQSDYNFNLSNLENHKVKAVHADINNLTLYKSGYEWSVETFKNGSTYTEQFLPELIINTSSEHMSTEWFDQIRFKPWEEKPIVAIQSNNYFGLEEHVNCVHSIDHMKKVYPMEKILYAGELQLKGYKRVMLIGRP